MKNKLRIAIVVSHPIQHFCPQYVSFSKCTDIQFKVFFASAIGFKKYVDASFQQEISWDNLHLDKFDHCFLNGEQVIQSDKNLDAVSVEKRLDEYKPDVVITYGYWQKLQRRVHRWALRNKVKIGFISDSELRHQRNIVKDFIKGIFIRKYFSAIDFFLSAGESNEDYYKKYGVKTDKIIRMHLPIDIYQYEDAYKMRGILRKQTRDTYLVKENEIVAIVVGKLVAWKNQDHIIEAMKLLEVKGIVMHLFIIGSGEMLEYVKHKAKDLKKSKVHFTGFINIEKLPAYYSASDMYILPASIEPHSVAVSEAIYMGCPVIVSDRCGSYGFDDDVQEGKNGFVYKYNDIEELSNKIKIIIDDENLRMRFSEYSHNISEKFQEKAHVTIIKDIKNRFPNKISKQNQISTSCDD